MQGRQPSQPNVPATSLSPAERLFYQIQNYGPHLDSLQQGVDINDHSSQPQAHYSRNLDWLLSKDTRVQSNSVLRPPRPPPSLSQGYQETRQMPLGMSLYSNPSTQINFHHANPLGKWLKVDISKLNNNLIEIKRPLAGGAGTRSTSSVRPFSTRHSYSSRNPFSTIQLSEGIRLQIQVFYNRGTRILLYSFS